MQKINIVIGTHGRFGEALIKSAEMIAGTIENVKSISLLPEMAIEDYMATVNDHLSTLDGTIIALVDLFGGTPSNAFSAFINTYDLKVVTGVNLPMLIDLYLKVSNAIDDLDIDVLLDQCLLTLGDSGVITNRLLEDDE